MKNKRLEGDLFMLAGIALLAFLAMLKIMS